VHFSKNYQKALVQKMPRIFYRFIWRPGIEE